MRYIPAETIESSDCWRAYAKGGGPQNSRHLGDRWGGVPNKSGSYLHPVWDIRGLWWAVCTLVCTLAFSRHPAPFERALVDAGGLEPPTPCV